MRWKTLSFLLVLLLLPILVSAKSQVIIEPMGNYITLAETATFKLSLTNDAEEKQLYSLFSFVQGWDIEPSPLGDKVMGVQPGKTRTTTIKARPTESFGPGLYNLALNVETDLGEKHLKTLPVYINPEKPMEYIPSIKVTIDMSKKINPQEPQPILLLMENKNPLDMPDLSIKLQSDLPEFNKETITSLSPLEKKNVEFTVVPGPFQKPGKYFLFFTFEKDGEAVKVISQEIEILPLNPDFSVEIEEDSSFLKTTKKLIVRNTGNIKSSQNITSPISFWELFFIYSEAKTIKEDGQRSLFWELTLSPDETADLKVTKNYRPPFYLLIVIFILIGIYFYLKSPFALSKEATSAKKDATLSNLKIVLHLKNLTKKSLKNIEVIDLVPGIADIEKSLDLGTLRPQEIKHTKKGTLVKWKIAEIEPKENRIISYQIRSKLKIVGALKLPRAKVVYRARKKKKSAYSNQFRISS